MTHALKKIRAFILAAISTEIVLFAGSVLMYIFDYPEGFKEYMTVEMWIFVAGLSIILDLSMFWIGYISLSRIRQKSDLEAAELIGADVQEAYNFGQLGLLVTDSKGMILWDSSLFKDRNIEILDANIFDLYPSLKELVGNVKNSTVKVSINERNYEVKYLQDAHLFIFKDCTDYETLSTYTRNQSIVIGLLLIDNYAEISGEADENSSTIALVKQEILDWARDNDVLLRRFKSDCYYILCNRLSLDKLIEDKFSILNSVKRLAKEDTQAPTLSIGLAFDFPDVIKLSDMASNALDIALSRGGDQAVISQYGENLVFFGGTTTAKEASSKVKVRSMADSVIALIKSSENVFVMGHIDSDMDAVGACLGIKAICDHFKKPCSIVYEPKLTERKAKSAIHNAFDKDFVDRFTLSLKDALDEIKESTLLILVDVSNPKMTLCPELLDKSTKTIVIDHHRRGEEFVERPVLSYIEPSASSTCELLCELMKYCSANPKIEINPTYATIMLSGMFLDSNFFKSKSTGARTFEAAEFLKQNDADNAKADEYLKDEFEEYSLITSIIQTMKTPSYGVVYCLCDDKDIVEKSLLAKVANQLLQLKGVNAAFVIGRVGSNEIRLSGRSDGSINVQLITEKLGGGGHFTSAAASFTGKDISNVESNFLEIINENLTAARSTNKED